MNNKINIILILITFFLISACSPQLTDGDYFFVNHKGADMPVWVKGNVESGVFIFMVHGGPGGISHVYSWASAFQSLEEKYAVVYWDQRGSGLSQGNAAAETLTPEQAYEDMNVVLSVIRLKYAPASLFVVSHSWGAMVSAGFLIHPDYQNTINGWAIIDGRINGPLSKALSRQWAIDQANLLLSEGNLDEKETDFWNEAIDWYATNEIINSSNNMKHSYYVNKAGGGIYNPAEYNDPAASGVPAALFGPFDPLQWLANGPRAAELLDSSSLDLTPSLSNVVCPVQIVWGIHDGVIPYPSATNIVESLGTASIDITLSDFSNSAHNPQFEEPDLFFTTIDQFVQNYR